jgi:hypothetical protein
MVFCIFFKRAQRCVWGVGAAPFPGGDPIYDAIERVARGGGRAIAHGTSIALADEEFIEGAVRQFWFNRQIGEANPSPFGTLFMLSNSNGR